MTNPISPTAEDGGDSCHKCDVNFPCWGDRSRCQRGFAKATGLPTLEQRAVEAMASFVAAAREFARYLDQWEKIKFETECGTVFVSVGREDPYPDSFTEIE